VLKARVRRVIRAQPDARLKEFAGNGKDERRGLRASEMDEAAGETGGL
jgi:hypothetical protein